MALRRFCKSVPKICLYISPSYYTMFGFVMVQSAIIKSCLFLNILMFMKISSTNAFCLRLKKKVSSDQLNAILMLWISEYFIFFKLR